MPLPRFRLSPRPELFRTKRRPPVWLVVGASLVLFLVFLLVAAVLGLLMSPDPFISVHTVNRGESPSRSHHASFILIIPEKSPGGRLRPFAEAVSGHLGEA